MAKVSGGASTDADFSPLLLKAHLGAEGMISKTNNRVKIIKLDYPYELPIVKANGSGTDAVWQFKQGNGAGIKAQYDLNVFFMIEQNKDKKIQISDNLYQAMPEIKINDKTLEKYEGGGYIQALPIGFFTS
jgi:hypothetical protein